MDYVNLPPSCSQITMSYKELMKDEEQLAIVVPTMNRPFMLERAVRWARHIRVPIYIGDSSRWKNYGLGAFSGTLATHYYHLCQLRGHQIYPLNEIQASYQVAIKSKAKYIAWCGDDDIMLQPALMKAVEILESAPEVTSVAGLSTIFATKGNNPYGRLESVVGPYPDLFFRVYRRWVIIDAWRQVMDLPSPEPDIDHIHGCYVRSTKLLQLLEEVDHNRVNLDQLMLMRQVHPNRVTSPLAGPDNIRTKLGRLFPRLQYLNQWLHSFDDRQLSLPALRRKGSRYPEYHDFERFIQQ